MAEMIRGFREKAGMSDTVSDISPNDVAQMACDAFNKMKGSVPGKHCPICLNKGYIEEISDSGETIMVECGCMPKRRAMWRIEESGLGTKIAECRFDNYLTSEPWQKSIYDGAKRFLEDYAGKWFYIGGQVGAGKTHICTAIAAEFLNRGKDVRYMLWRDEIVRIKAAVNDDEEYARLVVPLKTVPVLYIDDFFKTGIGDKGQKLRPTPGDINVAFEILNYRYNSSESVTILSGEWFVDELLNIDESIGSRIYHRSKDFALEIEREHSRNYRIKRAVV